MLQFTPFSQHQPGLIVALLSASYAEYFVDDPGCREPWQQSWEQYDSMILAHPETVGACGFVTCLAGQPIGFGSWDPRQFPTAIIGHNCILPDFRGQSYGKQQLSEVLRLLRQQGFAQVRVTTGEQPFFAPARRMYQACGFHAVPRGVSEPYTKTTSLQYELCLQQLPE